MSIPEPPTLERVFQWIGQKLIMASAAALVSLGSMAGAFWAVQWWAADRGGLLRTSAGDSDDEARQLNAATQELVALTREYLDRIEKEGGSRSEAFVLWRDRRFNPRVNDLRRRLHDSNIASNTLTELIGAADQLAAMALRPDSAELRNQATEAVFQATAAVEARIMVLGMDGSFTRRD
ncbi:MAG: hypothetical protein AMXMBFR84_43190 [Candidatus Hydrogenedentota bacterium]